MQKSSGSEARKEKTAMDIEGQTGLLIFKYKSRIKDYSPYILLRTLSLASMKSSCET